MNVNTDENRQDFVEKFQRLKEQVLDSVQRDKTDDKRQILNARSIFTADTNAERTLTVGNWTFRCRGLTQFRIHNVEGEQVRSIGKSFFCVHPRFRSQSSNKTNLLLPSNPIVPFTMSIALNFLSANISLFLDRPAMRSVRRTNPTL